ncbi:MAG: COX15/CtaA family protein, partial [Planctomycetes bacterium]|nr:COX15/CtaA family protein [Planctomycetota bacterium]
MSQTPLLIASPESEVVALRVKQAHEGTYPAGSILTFGFGTTVAMWATAYVCRLPGIQAPGWLLAAGFVVCLLLGGFVAARTLGGARRWLLGGRVGALSSLLNLLILGSFLRDQGNEAQAALWIPVFLIGGALLSAAGALAARPPTAPQERAWLGLFARVTAVATLILLAAGGLVTGHEAGLAVPDWPNSYTSNMFLYPLSKMTGGIYYEHAHRLFGTLVGLTTLVLAAQVAAREPRRWVKALAGAAFVLVCAQGILGGLRVTGHFTLSAEAGDLTPSLQLALVHGVTGQLFFVLIVGLAAILSPTWRRGPEVAPSESMTALRQSSHWLAVFLVGQLVLGALLRHFHTPTEYHAIAGALLAFAGVGIGVQAWIGAKRSSELPLGRCGVALAVLIGLQFCLGWVALAAIGVESKAIQAPLTTLHQTTGAMVLATAV